MNTTSLITDYIISGVLGLIAILLPYLMIDTHLFNYILHVEIKNATIFIIILSVIIYSFGVIYNQIADFLEEKVFWILRIKVIEVSENYVKEELLMDHHYALQLIVFSSETAYNYISFRRTMIRIIRAFLSLTVLFPVLHLFYCVLLIIIGVKLEFSFINLIIIFSNILLSALSISLLIKLYKGYYAAIINFVHVITNSKQNN